MNLEETKVIAKFVGRQGYVDSSLYTFNGVYDLINDTWYKLEDAKFHKDWNWLMLVIDKIENTVTNSVLNHIVVHIITIKGTREYNCYIEVGNQKRISITHKNRFKAVHEAVIEFIEWYNREYK